MKANHKKTDKIGSLSVEAGIIFPLIRKYYQRYENTELLPWDFVGLYILLSLSIRKPNNWSNGLLPKPIFVTTFHQSILLAELPDILSILNPQFITKRIKFKPSLSLASLTILDIFNLFNLLGLKNNNDLHVNQCLLHWSLGQRPIRLLHYIPSPMEVLQQQARGERVVTMFLTLNELSQHHTSKLTYMNGNQEHSRDPLEFLTHDLKHMEHYIDPVTHYEQKGFFRSILKVNNGKLKSFFLHSLEYSLEFWYEMEYVISDMNCFSTHLVRYIFAKLLIACRMKLHLERENQRKPEEIEDTLQSNNFEIELEARIAEDWARILQEMGIHPICENNELLNSSETFRCCMKLIDCSFKRIPELTVEEWTLIRDYFELVGKQKNTDVTP